MGPRPIADQTSCIQRRKGTLPVMLPCTQSTTQTVTVLAPWLVVLVAGMNSASHLSLTARYTRKLEERVTQSGTVKKGCITESEMRASDSQALSS